MSSGRHVADGGQAEMRVEGDDGVEGQGLVAAGGQQRGGGEDRHAMRCVKRVGQVMGEWQPGRATVRSG